jgi:hypothetical protein
VGRRGIEAAPGQEPRSLGWEPTFKMEGSSPEPAAGQAPAGNPPTHPSPKHP